MTVAKDILFGRMPDLKAYLDQGDALDDVDEYGLTLLIECAVAHRLDVAELLIKEGATVDLTDASGRTALHWAVYQSDIEMTTFLLSQGANPNAYTKDGLSILVYPLLRRQESLKHLLYQHGAKLDFALDFIHAKLLGHRYSLKGRVDVLNGQNEFVEVDFEGFILEFTVALVKDALYRFMSSFSTRRLRDHFQYFYPILDAFDMAASLLKLQYVRHFDAQHEALLERALSEPLLILPAASRGHAIGFVRYHDWWAKIDRGEHAKVAGSVNIYRITHPGQLTPAFLKQFLYKKQPRAFFHEKVHAILGLVPVAKLPIPPQTVGNCSWANIQAIIPAAYYMQQVAASSGPPFPDIEEAMMLFNTWVEWDQERALDECLHRFYHASTARKASIASMLACVLFQSCDASQARDLKRAEKIMTVVGLPDYHYILNSYLEEYCVKRLTFRGNNLLKLLDDCGVNPNIGVNPIATGLKEERK